MALVRRAVVVCLLWLAWGPATAWAVGPFPITETFRSTTLGTDWRIGGDAALTAPADGNGNGWLRLTPIATNKFGYVHNERSFPSSDGILAEFRYATHGGTGADGLAVFLYDGATPEGDFRIGPSGGALGYAGCPVPSGGGPPVPGLRNAYVGIAFDEYGNFARTGQCGRDGIGTGFQPDRVSVRGSEAAGYPLLASAQTSQTLIAPRASARRVKVAVSATGLLSVYITYPDGTVQTVTSGHQLPAAPATLKFGFVASTGGRTNYHEIRNATVVRPVDLVAAISDGAAGAARSGSRAWTATVSNSGPNPTTGATVKGVAGTPAMSNVRWTCTSAGGGGTCGAASGTGVPDTTATLPVGASVRYAITADVAPTTDYASMRVAVDTAAGGDTGESDPTDNVATDTTDLTPVADTAPAFALDPGATASQSTPATWRGGNLGFQRAWLRCAPDGTACTEIPGATGTTYTLQPADRGSTLRLRVRATNAAGTTEAVSAPAVLPGTTIVSGPPARTAQEPQFDFATDGPAGTTFECALDGGAFAACADPATFSGVPDGAHGLAVRARYGGLVDPTPATWAWTLDRATHVAISAPAAGVSADPRPALTGTAEPGDTLSVRVDGMPVATATATGGGFTVVLPADLADGPHVLAVVATDDLGNQATTSVALTVDTTPPMPPDVTAAPAALTSSPDSTFAFTGEPGAAFRCRLDAGAWTACASATAYAGLADGSHAFAVVAVDAAGNVSAPAQRDWTVDRQPPDPPVQLAGPGASSGAGTVRFEWAGEPGASLECALDGAAFAPCATSVVLEDLTPGGHVLQVRQIDLAGNTGSPARVAWDVVRPPATTPPTAPGPAPAPSAVQLRVAPEATLAGDRALRVGCAPAGGRISACTVALYARDGEGRRVRIGTGRAEPGAEQDGPVAVTVRLSALGRRLVRQAPGGLPVSVVVRAESADGAVLGDTASSVLHPQRVLVLPSINPFRFDAARLARPAARAALRALGRQLRHARSITCVGHTDDRGALAYNRALGRRRAAGVCRALRRAGARGARLRVRSAGETRPRASNATTAGRRANRRVELRVR